MNDRAFIDTNVLVYAYDRAEPEKQKQALATLDWLSSHKTGVVSTQVLAEFFVTVTRKIAAPLTIEEAAEQLRNHISVWEVLEITPLDVLEAIRGVQEYQFNYWDAQIWAVAMLNQVPVVLSEDFNVGAITEGVRFVNPFAVDLREIYTR
jgi:predicted nucleic acid-binding protein